MPRIFEKTQQQVPVRYVVFDGKQDLEKQLEKKIRGYLNPEARFIVLRDQDAEDCRAVKKRLLKKCHRTGRTECKVRIACRELESFYLGDLRPLRWASASPDIRDGSIRLSSEVQIRW